MDSQTHVEQQIEQQADEENLERIIRLGRWVDRHYDQLVTALAGIEETWQDAADDEDQPDVVRVLARSQRHTWMLLREEMNTLYDG